MKVINLFGGPGSGKSRTAARLFADMKDMGLKVELVNEYIKDHMYSGREDAKALQEYIFAKQHHKQHILRGQVDWVITDCPLLLSNIYAPRDDLYHHLENYILGSYNRYNNINIFLNRNHEIPYMQYGREQNLEQAMDVDNQIKLYLDSRMVPYTELLSRSEVTQDIWNDILVKTLKK